MVLILPSIVGTGVGASGAAFLVIIAGRVCASLCPLMPLGCWWRGLTIVVLSLNWLLGLVFQSVQLGAVSPGVSDVAAEGGEAVWLQETCLLPSCWYRDGWKRDPENVPDLVPREWGCPAWESPLPSSSSSPFCAGGGCASRVLWFSLGWWWSSLARGNSPPCKLVLIFSHLY